MCCPKCATTNPDHAKFCRACGTNLETVVLALAGYLIEAGAQIIEPRVATARAAF